MPVACGADVIIGPVLQFLIATGLEMYDYDTEIEEGPYGEENLDGDEVLDSDNDLEWCLSDDVIDKSSHDIARSLR